MSIKEPEKIPEFVKKNEPIEDHRENQILARAHKHQ
jgi:hypothetical protein